MKTRTMHDLLKASEIDAMWGREKIKELFHHNGTYIQWLFGRGADAAFIADNYSDLIEPRHFSHLKNNDASAAIISELALSGFNFNVQDHNGDAAISFVRDIQNVKRLVDAGASMTISNGKASFIAKHASVEGIKIMKDLSIDLNSQDADGNTALHITMMLCNAYEGIEGIRNLLDAGVDPTVRNGENKLPTEVGFTWLWDDRPEALMLMESVISKKNLLNELGETCQQPIMRRKM